MSFPASKNVAQEYLNKQPPSFIEAVSPTIRTHYAPSAAVVKGSKRIRLGISPDEDVTASTIVTGAVGGADVVARKFGMPAQDLTFPASKFGHRDIQGTTRHNPDVHENRRDFWEETPQTPRSIDRKRHFSGFMRDMNVENGVCDEQAASRAKFGSTCENNQRGIRRRTANARNLNVSATTRCDGDDEHEDVNSACAPLDWPFGGLDVSNGRQSEETAFAGRSGVSESRMLIPGLSSERSSPFVFRGILE